MSVRAASLSLGVVFVILWVWLALATHRIRNMRSQKNYYLAGWLSLVISSTLLVIVLTLVSRLRPSDDTEEARTRRNQIAQIVSFSVVGLGYIILLVIMGRKLDRRLEVVEMRKSMLPHQ